MAVVSKTQRTVVFMGAEGFDTSGAPQEGKGIVMGSIDLGAGTNGAVTVNASDFGLSVIHDVILAPKETAGYFAACVPVAGGKTATVTTWDHDSHTGTTDVGEFSFMASGILPGHGTNS